MGIKAYGPLTSARRFATVLDNSNLAKKRPEKRLRTILPKTSGRGAGGQVTVRHRGRREKRYYREIDWKREKDGVKGKVETIEYDPNRTVNLALILYEDGDRRYILAPEGLVPGMTVVSGELAPLAVGNCLPLSHIPIGTAVHNLEIVPGKGAQIVRGAGGAAVTMGEEGKWVVVKLPSGQIRRFWGNCRATIGQVGNTEWKNVRLGKAGRSRHMGIRPTVRGTAQHPDSHPHGGGEGRSGEGMSPKTAWGKPARGKKTRKKGKYSNKSIVKSLVN